MKFESQINNGVADVIKSRQVKTCASGSGHDQNWFMIEDHHAPPLSSPLTLIKSMLIWDFCIISYQGCCISGCKALELSLVTFKKWIIAIIKCTKVRICQK